MKSGILYGIGVGPGDPGLMTVKAVQTARDCDVIAVPHKDREKCLALKIALGAAPELAEKTILTVDMPMTKDKQRLEAAYVAGTKLLTDTLDQGKNVAFLHWETLRCIQPTCIFTAGWRRWAMRQKSFPV